MTKRPVLMLGGSSDIALATARRFAAAGYPIQLAARRPDELEPERSDLSLRHGVQVTLHHFDALEFDRIEAFYDDLPETPGIVVCAVGVLGDQAEAERNPHHARLVAESNFIGPMVALEAAARRLSQLDEDTAIIGISSVAGDRGRAKNYWYGASKAAFTAGLSGLRQRSCATRLHVMTVKPGFVETKMTANMETIGFLTSKPNEIADILFRGFEKRRFVVVPILWKFVMTVICLLPERVFRHLKF